MLHTYMCGSLLLLTCQASLSSGVKPGLSGRMIWNIGGDDLVSFDISYLHSPQAVHDVDDMLAHAIDRIGSQDSGIGSNAGGSVTGRIDQIQITAASIGGMGRLKKRSGQGKLSVVRSIRKIHLASNVAGVCV